MADHERARRRMCGNRGAHRRDDLVDSARMEQLAIQRLSLAVVAKIQAKHVETGGVQSGADGQDVGRLGATFPAVQQDREAATLDPATGCAVPSSRTPSPQSTISRRAPASSPRARRRKSPCRSAHAASNDWTCRWCRPGGARNARRGGCETLCIGIDFGGNPSRRRAR